MYNLKINGQRVTNLRLSGENIAKIFTGAITMWNDPALQADNPGLVMPARAVVPVVRSDGSGSTAQFTRWMIARHGGLWNDYCNRSGRAPACGSTSFYPTIPGGMKAQSGDLGIAGYVSQGFAEGAIGYVNYSYALGVQFPVAKVLNAAGFYTEPTPENVAVSLLQARINTDANDPAVYLTQQLDGVYADPDPRNYQLSSYSYFILPTKVGGQFNEAKGRTLGEFAYYAMCQAQQQSASLGYSPMPFNLVEASFDQIRKIPGVVEKNLGNGDCKNPTFSPDGTNVLARDAPQPQECDRQGPTQCATGTGGVKTVATPTAAAPVAAAGGAAAPGTPTAGAAPGADTAAATDAAATGGAATGGAPTGGAATGVAATGGAATAGAATGGATTAGAATDGATTSGATAGDPAVAGDPAAGAATEICDPDTGICGQVATAIAGGAAAAGATVGAITPTTLKQGSGWGATQTLTLLVTLFTLGLVLIPAIAWRRLNQKSPA